MTSSRVGAPLIEARNITKHYDGFTLQAVSLTVEQGQIVGVIGQNGAGKSTTIKALLGIFGIDAGDARILGVDARGRSGADAAVNERVGVVFDTVSMPPHIKIAEVGKLMDRAYQTWDARVFEEYLHRFKLDSKIAEVGKLMDRAYQTWDARVFEEYLHRFKLESKKAIKELSRGMGMKLSLACALAHNPQVLFLDEATAGLDPMARDEVLDMLREFVAVEDAAGNPQHAILMSSHITSDLVAVEDAAGNPQHAILMSSHITSDLDKIADTVVCIDDGRIVFACDKDEICDLMGVARCRAAEVEQVLTVPCGGGRAGADERAGTYGGARFASRLWRGPARSRSF